MTTTHRVDTARTVAQTTDLDEEIRRDLDIARKLAEAGVPIFCAYPDEAAATGYRIPRDWQHTEASASYVDAWRPGMALCAVMGQGLDLVDYDTRNGADPHGLDDVLPPVYAAAATPSDGAHLFVASLGVRSRDGVQPGIDVKAGDAGGNGRGFAFIAPTVRRSKTDGSHRKYAWTKPPDLVALASATPAEGAGLALLVGEARGEGRTRRVPPAGDTIPEGSRNSRLTSMAGSMRNRGMSLAAIQAALQAENAARCDPPLPESEVVSIAASVARYEPEPRQVRRQEQRLNAKAEVRRLRLEPASAITMRPTRWLWNTSGDSHHPSDREGRLPEGSLTTAVGRAGIGKSQFAAWLTAQLTRGALPGTCYGTPRAVIYCATEDSWEMTIAPRLAAAGADLDLVFRVAVAEGEGGLVLPLDTEALRGLITGVSATAVIFDPLLSLLDSAVDDYRAKEVRAALEPLVAVLNDTKATGLGIAHFTKASGNDPLMLISGSGAFGQLIRAAIGFAKDEESGGFVMSTIKNNLGREDLPSLSYTIEGVPIATPEGEAWTSRLVLTGESTRTVRDLLREAARPPVEMSAAREIDIWLRDYLEAAGGSAPAREAYAAGAPAGYSNNAISKARMRIGATSVREGFGSEASYLWSLAAPSPSIDSHGFLRPHGGIHGVHEESMENDFSSQSAEAGREVRL